MSFFGESQTSSHQQKVPVKINQSQTKHKNFLKRHFHWHVLAEPLSWPLMPVEHEEAGSPPEGSVSRGGW